ncbi:hypothetical protein TELCIR_14624, partial [Teladorsagia circumcincta]
WVEYTRDYCLIENTYYIPMNDPNMPSLAYREKAELPYYQKRQEGIEKIANHIYRATHRNYKNVGSIWQ